MADERDAMSDDRIKSLVDEVAQDPRTKELRSAFIKVPIGGAIGGLLGFLIGRQIRMAPL